MTSVELLMKLDLSDFQTEEHTFEIEVERISNILKKKGIDESFVVKCRTVDADMVYDYDMATIETTSNGIKVDKSNLYKASLSICNYAIIDPPFNDTGLLGMLGIKMKQPTPEETWKKLFVKAEIVSIAQSVVEFSRKYINAEEVAEEKKAIKEKVKNS